MDYKKLAQLLFPHINKSPEEYEKMYPERDLPKEPDSVRVRQVLCIWGIFTEPL